MFKSLIKHDNARARSAEARAGSDWHPGGNVQGSRLHLRVGALGHQPACQTPGIRVRGRASRKGSQHAPWCFAWYQHCGEQVVRLSSECARRSQKVPKEEQPKKMPKKASAKPERPAHGAAAAELPQPVDDAELPPRPPLVRPRCLWALLSAFPALHDPLPPDREQMPRRIPVGRAL